MIKGEIGQIILRIVFGFIFFAHGLDKFQGGIANTAGFFDSLGIPGFLAYVVAVIELLGGIAMILGIGTRIVAGLFTAIMLGAILFVNLPGGLLGNEELPGFELDLILLSISIYFLLSDRVSLALDNKFSRSTEN